MTLALESVDLVFNNDDLSPSPCQVQVEEEDFEDAVEIQPMPESMTLELAIAETQAALNLFLNNKFQLAKEKMEPWADRSMYHALGYGTILYIQAMMTFDAGDIQVAVKQSKVSTRVCDFYRKPCSLTSQMTKFVRRLNSSYTEEQIHAELCYAESLLERAMLTFVEDESLSSFIKGALRVRSCFTSYKECHSIMHEHTGRNGEEYRFHEHFESGVRMGLGAFNLMISLLPARILRLLEFVGFSGDKEGGLTQLYTACALKNGLRSPLCILIVLGFETVVRYVLGLGGADIPHCSRLVGQLLHQYPNGALVLYIAGRLELVKGDIDKAIDYFMKSIQAQEEWRQFHHLCFWELMFCYAFKRDWRSAHDFAHKLYTHNKWSRSTYAYLSAVFLSALQEWNLCWDERALVKKMLQEVPKLRQRIAGKSIPIEKFCTMKAQKYFQAKERLFLPHLEIIYLWNGFQILGQDSELLKPILTEVEETIVKRGAIGDLDVDSRCLCLLLKAMCLKYLQSPFQAQQCLKEIISLEKELKDFTYLIPNAYLELGLILIDENNLTEATKCLTKSKDCKGYLLESRVHFRLHAAADKIKGLAL